MTCDRLLSLDVLEIFYRVSAMGRNSFRMAFFQKTRLQAAALIACHMKRDMVGGCSACGRCRTNMSNEVTFPSIITLFFYYDLFMSEWGV